MLKSERRLSSLLLMLKVQMLVKSKGRVRSGHNSSVRVEHEALNVLEVSDDSVCQMS